MGSLVGDERAIHGGDKLLAQCLRWSVGSEVEDSYPQQPLNEQCSAAVIGGSMVQTSNCTLETANRRVRDVIGS